MCLPGLKVISEFSCKLLFNSNSVVEDLPLLRTTFEFKLNSNGFLYILFYISL